MDSSTFKKQFLPFHPKLYRIALTLVGNKDDAEDILQEVYCKMWNKRMELQDIQNPEAYSVTLVKNMCVDFLRSPLATRHNEQIEAVKTFYESTPDKEMERNEEVETVKRLIDNLPENQKIVIKLCGMEEYSMKEVEDITNLTATNIRTLLFRARKTIKEQYDKIKRL